MTELKTLKDLKESQLRVYKEMRERCHIRVFYNAAKEEAIKWIKELQKRPEYLHSGIRWRYSDSTMRKIEWIKHFFNITEEDLK